jgi:DNA relaxase NicK
MDLTAKIDWLAFTVFDQENNYLAFWKEYLAQRLGELQPKEHGGRGYQKMYVGLAGAKVYTQPSSVGLKGMHFHVELPGEAVSCLLPSDLQAIYQTGVGGKKIGDLKIRYTRIDLAIDHGDFTPFDIWNELLEGRVVTYASRKSVKQDYSPFNPKDNGELGTCTVYIGSENSERRIRFYDRRGYTRVELQLRQDWADAIAQVILKAKYQDWLGLMLGFIDTYINFPTDWWSEFVKQREIVDIIVKSARTVSLEKLTKWMTLQVAPGLFAYQKVLGRYEFWKWLCDTIKENPKRLDPWRAIMEMA